MARLCALCGRVLNDPVSQVGVGPACLRRSSGRTERQGPPGLRIVTPAPEIPGQSDLPLPPLQPTEKTCDDQHPGRCRHRCGGGRPARPGAARRLVLAHQPKRDHSGPYRGPAVKGPTREQLLAVVEQAETQGRLTAAEAALLRVGIAILDASRTQVSGLRTALHTARRERDAARAELDRHRVTGAESARGSPEGSSPPTPGVKVGSGRESGCSRTLAFAAGWCRRILQNLETFPCLMHGSFD